MHEHLVDDDLEEQRRDQRKQLKEERGDQHLAQQTAVFVHGAQEPGDVEAAREIDQAGAPRHQDECGRSTPLQARLGSSRGGRQRVLDKDLAVVADLAEDEEAAVRMTRDGRQRCAGKPLPGRFRARALQAKLLGTAQHLRDPDPGPRSDGGFARRIAADAMETQEHDQGGHARIGLLRLRL